jgi:hypothetical protein
MVVAISVQGAKEAERAVEELDGKDRSNAMRRAVRAAAKPMQAALKAVAASSDVPRSFQKVPAAKVSTRGGATGREIEARVRPSSPLFNIFEPGAGEHGIEGELLAGPEGGSSWTAEGRKRPAAFAARGRVSHPGMRSRPILPAAFARGAPEAERIMADAIFAPARGPVMGA